jgi:hypothetical protein
MESMMTNEALTSGEEQVGIVLRQTGKSVKSGTIDSHEDGRGEA